MLQNNTQIHNLKTKLFGIIVVDDHDSWDLSDCKNIIFIDTEEATGKTLTINGIMHIYT